MCNMWFLPPKMLFLLFVIHKVLAQRVIETALGKIEGKTISTPQGKKIDVFYGIPYAQPPIGNLRFRYPVPISPWNGTLKADVKPHSCWQTLDTVFGKFEGSDMWNANTDMNEDCLKLNIWIPHPYPTSSAVLVWIYGGGFYSGTSTLDVYNGEILAAEGDIIIISFNYRVGPFGFLYFGTSDAPGNAGMFDMIESLKWIRNNIKSFGGDPNRITLFGESAGAVAVNLLQLSCHSRHLFQNAILQSGSASSSWAVASPVRMKDIGFKFASSLKCHRNKNKLTELVQCLRNKTASQILEVVLDVQELVEFAFVPVIDGDFLEKTPLEYISSGDFKEGPILAGINAEEGSYFLIYSFGELLPMKDEVTLSKEQFLSLLPKIRHSFDNITEILEFKYKNESNTYVDALDKLVGDLYFTCPVNELMNGFANANLSNLYMYLFTHRSSKNPWPKWMGVMHGDEIPYVFGQPFLNENYTDEEKDLSLAMIKYWSNFAKTGNVNSPQKIEVNWPSYKIPDKKYLTLGPGRTVGEKWRESFCDFLKTI
ncbi:acetylcholinesterase-like [Centruroides sculpturatus]|uniref:acetylcholinesterase-like n=1 Tax=Centruroides sculpturatus TaxID=218467 RepID=UPI000C6DBAA5|nr:acetylcholinesterase-like [Centruroides sculpturatus]